MPLLYLQRARVFLNLFIHLVLLTTVCQKKRYVLIRFHYMHVYYLHTCAYTGRVFYINCLYTCPFSIFWSCIKRWVCLVRKFAHELTRSTRTCCSRISASGAVLRSKLSRSRSRRRSRSRSRSTSTSTSRSKS